MATHLVTGYAGYEHIKSEDQGSFNAAFFGTGQFVMEAGNQLEGSIVDNNTIRILSGDILMKGRHIRVDSNTYEDMNIETGTAGVNRCDLIVMEYSKDETTGTETAFLRVLKGAETAGAAEPPAYTDGDILNGAKLNQMPLYKAMIEGVVLTNIECLFETITTYEAMARKYANEFKKEITDLKTTNILDTLEEVEANDQQNMFMGALAGKKLSENVDILNDAKHTHSNKSALDGITAALISNWNGAVTKLTDAIATMTVTGAETTIAAESATAIHFSYTIPSGYTAVGVVGYYTGNTYILPLRITPNRMDVKSVTGSDQSFTPTLTVLLVKTDLT